MQAAATAGSGYSVDQVASAAAEAGIDPPFVSLALAEQRPAPAAIDRVADLVFGRDTSELVVSRHMDAPAGRCLGAIGRALRSSVCRCDLLEAVGDPLDGGTLVFALPDVGWDKSSPWAYLRWIGARYLSASIRRDPSGPGCTVTYHADIVRGRRALAWTLLGFDALVGVVAIAGGIAAGGWEGLLALPAVPLAALFTRATFRLSARRARDEMARALVGVDGALRGADVFGDGTV